MALKENYKDDILDTSQNVKRKYQMENNGDGTVSFTDVTEYTQQGDSFGSGDINATNSKVNTLDANLDGFKFYPTGTGIVGLIADDSAYTDEDGNYVVWGTETANQLVADNPNTYKSVPSEEDTRGKDGSDLAYKFGGNSMPITLENIKIVYNSSNSNAGLTIDVNQYKTVRIYNIYSTQSGNIGYWKYTIDNTSYAITTTNYLELDVSNAHYLRFEVGSAAGSTVCAMSIGKLECV